MLVGLDRQALRHVHRSFQGRCRLRHFGRTHERGGVEEAVRQGGVMCGNPIAGPGGRKRARSTRSSSARRKRFSSAVLEAAARPTLDQQATSILPPLNVRNGPVWPLGLRRACASGSSAATPISTPMRRSRSPYAFTERLRQLGWSEGSSIAIEYRWAQGPPEPHLSYP